MATFIFRMAASFGFERRGDGPQAGAILIVVAFGVWWLG
jgi:hypothetical protein